MSDYEEIKKQLEEERKRGSFVYLPSPIMDMDHSFHMPIIEVINLREDEIYSSKKKFRLHYNGLLRLGRSAGFEWSVSDTCRTDDRRDINYCSYRAVGGPRKADGKIDPQSAEKDIDLTVTKMELEDQYIVSWGKIGNNKNDQWKKSGHETMETYIPAMVRRDMIQKLKNKLTFVESGAKARVIRFILGIPYEFSDGKKLLDTRFVIVQYSLNPQQPDVKKSLMLSLSGSMNMVYGGANEAVQIPHTPDVDIIDIGEDDDGAAEAESDEFNIYDIMEQEGFETLSVDDQERWFKYYVDKIGYNWAECTGDLKGKPISESTQVWRNNFFGFIKKTYTVQQSKKES